MTPEGVKSSYRRALREWVKVRRYTGTGPNRPYFEARARARVMGYTPQELIGTIQEGDSKAIVYADDLVANGLLLPITTNDKLIRRGKEFAIIDVDDETRRINGVLVAIELQVRG
jgi:hypothetical protein